MERDFVSLQQHVPRYRIWTLTALQHVHYLFLPADHERQVTPWPRQPNLAPDFELPDAMAWWSYILFLLTLDMSTRIENVLVT